jgi:hypothetical protein
MNQLTIFVNDNPVFEYDKSTPLEDSKLEFLDDMDRGMDRGMRIQGEMIDNPDNAQRAKFVILNMIKALQQDNQAIVQSSCAYLAMRMPGLTEVHANDGEGRIDIELVEQALN